MPRPTGYLPIPLLALAISVACAPTPPRPAPASSSPIAATEAPAAPASIAQQRALRRALNTRAAGAYIAKDFAGCAKLFAAAGDPYRAAGCHASGGERDAAFAQLARAIDGKFRDLEKLDADPDLAALHADPRWTAERDRLAGKIAAGDLTVNPELRRIHAEDQADRRVESGTAIDWSKVGPRDDRRREQVAAILAAGGARSSADYFRAAIVYQHGDTLEDIRRAQQLALEAIELDPHSDAAYWLAAAAEDRQLLFQKKPQKWGTQSEKIDGRWVVSEVDPAITDAQRAEWNVPPLAEAKARAAHMNAKP